MKKVEYYPKRIDLTHFALAKFSEQAGDQPETTYHLQLDISKDDMLCDCPNRRRGKHINDKHGVMIREWLAKGEPIGYFDNQGAWHDRSELGANPWDELDSLRDEAGPNGDLGDEDDSEVGSLDGEDQAEHR